jgi:hypothetical protein
MVMSRSRGAAALFLALAGLTLSGLPSSAAVPADDAPVDAVDEGSVDFPFNVHDGEPFVFPVGYNDLLGDGPTSLTIETQPSHGTAIIDTEHAWLVYTPVDGYLGTDQLTYRLTDSYGIGGPDTDTATVYLNVFDDKPMDTVRVVNVGVGQTEPFELGNRPSMFRDCPTNSACGTVVTDEPDLGIVTVLGQNDGSYQAGPSPGTDTFTTRFTDADGDTATATVTVVVWPASPPPPPADPTGDGDDVLTVKGRRFGSVRLLSDAELGEGVTIRGCPSSPHADISCDTWSMDYVHRDWWFGKETLDYVRSDGITEHVTVTVTPRLVKYFFDFTPTRNDTYVAGDSETFEFVMDTDEGEVPPGEVMQVQTRRKGTTAWTTRELPLKGGLQKFRLDVPTVHHELRLRHPGSDWLAAFTTKATQLTVVPRLTARLSSTSGPGGRPVSISGEIGPVVKGQKLLLQRWSPAAHAYVTLQTKTITTNSSSIDPGKAFSFTVTPNAKGTTYYQVTAAAVPGRAAATRSALNYRAR